MHKPTDDQIHLAHLLVGISIGIILGLIMGMWITSDNIARAVDHANEEWERCEYVVPHEQVEDTPSEWRDIERTPTGDSWCIRTK